MIRDDEKFFAEVKDANLASDDFESVMYWYISGGVDVAKIKLDQIQGENDEKRKADLRLVQGGGNRKK